MKIVFERIYERDIDLLLIRLFAENHPACGLFCRKTGIEGYSIKEIRHSAKSLHGESDVEVWMEADNQRYVLMFEDKINAPAQPKQCARYSDRGNAYIRNGKADRFSVFIVAPADYLAANGEAKKYDKFQVSFEELKEQMYPDHDTFMIAILDRGIEKYRNAIIIDQQVTAFWQAYIAFQEKYAPELDLRKNISERGATSSWISFSTALSGVSIWHKSERGFMDLQFNGKAGKIETLRQMFSDQFTQSQWHKTGKSASLRIEVPPVDFTKPFNEYRDAMPQIFDAARVLAKFAGKLQTDGITLP